MSVRIVRLLVVALLAAVAITERAPSREPPPEPIKIPEKVQKDFGKNTIGILTGVTRVEVFQLDPKPAQKVGPGTIGSSPHLWNISSTGKEKDKTFAAKIQTVLLDGAMDTWSGSNRGVVSFQSHIAFRLWKDKDSVVVIVDFKTGLISVLTYDAQGKYLSYSGADCRYDGKGEFEKEFDKKGELFERVKALAVEAFPDDEKIKTLKQPEEPKRVRDEVPANLLTALEKGDPFELLSLDPRDQEDLKDGFHKYPILGKTQVKDAETRKKLIAALKKGVEDNDGAAAGCFIPRHGIRVKHDGKTIDFVLCFECLSTDVYIDDKEVGGLRTTRNPKASPKPVFDEVLKAAKVPLPKK